MDPFTALPIEIRQVILEELTSLRDLQSAILASRPLLLGYTASRTLTRQRIFFNQYQKRLKSELRRVTTTSSHQRVIKDVLYAAARWIQQLAGDDPHDGLILREILWPHVLAEQQQNLRSKPPSDENYIPGLYCSWAEELASAYWQFHLDSRAVEIETETLKFMTSHNCCLSDPWLKWFDATITASVRRGRQIYAAKMCVEMWTRIDRGNNHNHSEPPEGFSSIKIELDGLAMVKITSKLCRPRRSSIIRSNVEVDSAFRSAWEFLRLHAADQPGIFCYQCFDAAMLLVKVTKASQVAIEPCEPHAERIWQNFLPRSPAFNTWSDLLVDAYTNTIEGVMVIWRKLQETIPPSSFPDTDLDWSRSIILQLRKEKLMDESLSFQAGIFELLPPSNRHFNSFGRNLSDAYVRNNQIHKAIGVRERVLQHLSESSPMRPTLVLALTDLYDKVGRMNTRRHRPLSFGSDGQAAALMREGLC